MAKYHKNPNFQKCEPSQKKIAFKEAYQQVRYLLNNLECSGSVVTESKARDIITNMIGKMKWDNSEVYYDALNSRNLFRVNSFEEYDYEHRKWCRKHRLVSPLAKGEGKLPA